MGFVLQAICTKCKYQSDKLTIGDGVHFIFICENCKSIVNAQRIPFRYTWSPCPNCKNLLRQTAWVDGANLLVSFDEPIQSNYQCPRCRENPLSFKEILHFSHGFDDLIPAIGMLVHGRFTKRGELEIPFLSQSYCVAHLENTVVHPLEEIMELRITRLEPEPTDDKSKPSVRMNMFLEFVRYLSQEDLERESMEQPMFESKTTEFIKRAGLFSNDNAA